MTPFSRRPKAQQRVTLREQLLSDNDGGESSLPASPYQPLYLSSLALWGKTWIGKAYEPPCVELDKFGALSQGKNASFIGWTSNSDGPHFLQGSSLQVHDTSLRLLTHITVTMGDNSAHICAQLRRLPLLEFIELIAGLAVHAIDLHTLPRMVRLELRDLYPSALAVPQSCKAALTLTCLSSRKCLEWYLKGAGLALQSPLTIQTLGSPRKYHLCNGHLSEICEPEQEE